MASRRLYWACWFVATLLTGVVCGFMLGHALILAPFLDWLLVRPGPEQPAATYAAYRASAGRAGLRLYYLVAGLQGLSAVVFAALALVSGRHRAAAVLAGAAGAAWLLIHYGSGFGALEAAVVAAQGPVPPDLARRFAAWNVAIHLAHAAALVLALAALLAVPLIALRERR